MKKFSITLFLLLTSCSIGFSQVSFASKIEFGYLKFLGTMVVVDAAENWKGYYLNNNQNGLDVKLINGIKFKEKVLAGVGVGYINFEGINGISIFSDLEFRSVKKKVAPLLNTKIGYSRIWNQYERGTGTAFLELGGGLNYKLSDKLEIYIQSGFIFTQQSSLIPIKVGLHF